jgi:ABC-type glycerol-3-phosphate transport system substrate-binding protein
MVYENIYHRNKNAIMAMEGFCMKKVISRTTLFILLILAMTGCSSNNTNEKGRDEASNNKLANGMYVEEDIEIPSDIHNIISFMVSPEEKIELYGYGSTNNYLKYLYVDKEWVEDESDALKKVLSSTPIQIDRLFYGEDEYLYVLANRFPSYRNTLYRLSNSGELEIIDVKRFEDTYEEWNDLPYRPTSIKVLEKGMIAVTYVWREGEIYSPDGQSTVGEFTCGYPSAMTARGNYLYFVDENNSKILKFDVEKNEELAFVPLEIDISNDGIIRYDGDTIYICDKSGIHLKKDGGSIMETLFEGSQGALGAPSINLYDFIIGSKDDYYYMLQEDYGGPVSIIKHVYFDENASILPEEELSIFSLEECNTIRHAIISFQQSHPGIRINYRVANMNSKAVYTYGLKDPNANVTLQDQINALNTELLADKGADIIVLDGLPIDSYLEKGVLEDMGDIFNPMIKNDELLSNIANDFVRGKKVYTMPVRIKVPIIYGSSQAIEAAKSLEELAAYAKISPDTPLLNPSNYRAMAAWFLFLYYNEILNDVNEIDQVLLLGFLENINIIATNIEASDDVPIDWMNSAKGTTVGYWVSGIMNVHKKITQANIDEAFGILDFSVPIEAIKNLNGAFSVVNNTYRANTLVGINDGGSNKALAKEFVQYLFSEEVQKEVLLDGFPINKLAMEDLVVRNSDTTSSIGDMDYSILATYPSLQKRELIYEQIKALERPMENDMTMIDMILGEAERYLRGDISAQQAVDNTLGSINTYLAE